MKKNGTLVLAGIFCLSYSVACAADKTNFEVANNSYDSITSDAQDSADLWDKTTKPTGSDSPEWTPANTSPSLVTFPEGSEFVYVTNRDMVSDNVHHTYMLAAVPKSGSVLIQSYSGGYGNLSVYATPTSLYCSGSGLCSSFFKLGYYKK